MEKTFLPIHFEHVYYPNSNSELSDLIKPEFVVVFISLGVLIWRVIGILVSNLAVGLEYLTAAYVTRTGFSFLRDWNEFIFEYHYNEQGVNTV